MMTPLQSFMSCPDAIDMQLLLVCGCSYATATTHAAVGGDEITGCDLARRGNFFHIPRLVDIAFSLFFRAIMRKEVQPSCCVLAEE